MSTQQRRPADLHTFLNQVEAYRKDVFADDAKDTVRAVMGNEAGDLDSCAGALLQAFSATLQTQQVHIPVLNFKREDIVLRKDTGWLFDKLGINKVQLTYVDEVDLLQLNRVGRLQLTLVDHNKLAPSQAVLEPSIVCIFDHHKDEQLYAQQTANARRIEFGVGSSVSLIAQQLFHIGAVDRDVATLIIATILLDTQHLNSQRTSFKEVDTQMLTRAKAVAPTDTLQLYTQLSALRADLSGLTVTQLLRKDAKAGCVGNLSYVISSVPGMSIADVLEQNTDIEAQLSSVLQTRGLDFVVAMFAFSSPTTNEFQRQMLVAAADHTRLDQLCEKLEQQQQYLGLLPLEPSLQKQEEAERKQQGMPGGEGGEGGEGEGGEGGEGEGKQQQGEDARAAEFPVNLRYFQQGVSRSSRKVVLPVFNEILDSMQQQP
eukprot:CAMPEP_0175181176 /NCGR_PEP_ID=MMETSP0087-20121206/36504_1 /TAXON_ID=136419 /ORGANISM="Unknown Unknown, Strain D1" /LENGTH=429 /DNA_ID=CAMNT_0016473651 /DNA_START=68 /DNA_END=1357 /DNA_ORIENTATION=-